MDIVEFGGCFYAIIILRKFVKMGCIDAKEDICFNINSNYLAYRV